jgi:hypothetical protein
MRRAAITVLIVAISSVVSEAQTTNPASKPQTEDKHSGAPLGQFTAGPFIVTPTFRIGTLAVDTNVGYTRDRTADFVASGGPGLDIALPFLDHWKLDLRGSSEYFYFHETRELRRWTGGGDASLFWKTTGTEASFSARVNRDFSRPNFEVDTRVATDQRFLGADFQRDLGRLTLALNAYYSATRVQEGQEFRGTDLFASLTVDRYRGGAELRYRVTPVSSLLFEGGYEETHFPNAAIRNFSEQNAGVGILTTGLLDGRATAGVRRTRLLQGTAEKTQPYFRADLRQQLGRRFALTERYTHESAVSAFATDGDLPTFERRSLDVLLAIEITRRIDMRLGGGRDRTVSNGLVTVILDDGTAGSAKRDDVSYVGRADIGMRLGRARTSIFVSYTTRESLFFSDFGIQGFQAGARVEYAPQGSR